jgi:tetratricopeptide (TPR) repeat protein
LQALGFHKDAIIDYSKAILLEPENCNLYFCRSNSKKALEDFEGLIEDIEIAIRLSKIDNELNENYHIGAQEMGWPEGHTSLYQSNLEMAKLMMMNHQQKKDKDDQ